MLIYKFYKLPAIFSSDHDAETHAFPPLFRHSDVTAHLITVITEQITVMDFIMSAKTACLFSFIYFSKASVIEIDSDKMLIAMLVSIKRVS